MTDKFAILRRALDSARTDIVALEAGRLPDGTAIETLPRLSSWGLSADSRPDYPQLVGLVQGHPRLPDGAAITTSVVLWMDERRKLARTLNTLYRLERGLSEELQDMQ